MSRVATMQLVTVNTVTAKGDKVGYNIALNAFVAGGKGQFFLLIFLVANFAI
jgi:hypothetical protein